MHFIHGSQSPMPVSASADTVERLPDAHLEIVDGAGHFIWFERGGAVRTALERLIAA
jgi:pimeloyl-ACP methyl ester carboxylesterase